VKGGRAGETSLLPFARPCLRACLPRLACGRVSAPPPPVHGGGGEGGRQWGRRSVYAGVLPRHAYYHAQSSPCVTRAPPRSPLHTLSSHPSPLPLFPPPSGRACRRVWVRVQARPLARPRRLPPTAAFTPAYLSVRWCAFNNGAKGKLLPSAAENGRDERGCGLQLTRAVLHAPLPGRKWRGSPPSTSLAFFLQPSRPTANETHVSCGRSNGHVSLTDASGLRVSPAVPSVCIYRLRGMGHGMRHRVSGMRRPFAWHEAPFAWHEAPFAWHEAPFAWHEAPFAWYEAPFAWHGVRFAGDARYME